MCLCIVTCNAFENPAWILTIRVWNYLQMCFGFKLMSVFNTVGSVLLLTTFDFSVQIIHSLMVFYLKHLDENVDVKFVLCNKSILH